MAKIPTQTHIEMLANGYSQFVDTLPVGIFRISHDGRIIFCNRTLTRIFGYKYIKDLLDRPISQFYRTKKKKDALIRILQDTGQIVEKPLPFIQRDGRRIWCAVTGKTVENRGRTLFYDGIFRDITAAFHENKKTHYLDETEDGLSDFIIILNLEGVLLDINRSGAKFLGARKSELLGKRLNDFITPRYRDLFLLFLSDILTIGHDEGVLTLNDKGGRDHHIQFHAHLVKRDGISHHIKVTGRDVTDRIKNRREQLVKERFQGVLEMAGGAAHNLNQPLMIINNILNEVLSDLKPKGGDTYDSLMLVHNQLKRLNEIAKKIGRIKKYEAMDYVAGVKIVDIDRASDADVKRTVR